MNILVMGLGQYPKGSGVIVTEYLAKQGHDVTVVEPYYKPAMDANVVRAQAYPNVTVVLNKRGTAFVKKADMIVRHQRMRIDEPEMVEARRLGKPIETELSLFLKACPAKVIGITGTRGKSTTTALTYALLEAGLGTRVWLGGNILLSPLTFLHRIKRDHLVVLEMSSFQLEGTGSAGISPQIAVWTNLMRDHLNTYPSMKEYAEAKAQIFRHQQEDGVVFLPKDRSFNAYADSAPGQVIRFGSAESEASKIVATTRTRLAGEHNVRNMEIAVTVARYMGVRVSVIRRVLKSFAGLPGREEILGTFRGITIVNDTTATTPDGTIVALSRFVIPAQIGIRPRSKAVDSLRQPADHGNDKRTIHLIFGGADKELEFESSARTIKSHASTVWLLPGTAHEKIVSAWKQARVSWTDVLDLREALTRIKSLARKGDVVLLSPGCASFGLFENEFHRGEVFAKLVKKLFR